MAVAVASSLDGFIASALKEDIRIDGRRPFDSRRLNIKFSREDGTAEVQLGQTHVMCVVSCQLVPPFADRPNEGSLSVFTEFSPMADPSFETGRQGENAVELGRVVDRGLRESRAIDMESLCVIAGKAVWALRIDISILDNGGNLTDAACIAALAALCSFRRPECSTETGEVVIYPPEIREPLPLILHHLPISVTFAFFGDGDLVVMDPSYKEELVMKGKLTVTMNVHGDICTVQKGGGIGVRSTEIMRCLRIASTKVLELTTSLKKAIEAYETDRAQRKVKRHRNIFAQGTQYDISESHKKDTEMAEGIPGNGETVEGMSGGSSESDSDDDKEINEDTKANRELGRNIQKPPKDSLFEGGASKWDGATHPISSTDQATNPSKCDAEGFLNEVSAAIANMGKGKQNVIKKNKRRKRRDNEK